MHLALTTFLLQVTADPSKPLTYDTPVGDLPIVDDARWSAAFTSHSWGALLVWFVLMIVLQAVTWPLVRRIFARFPDRGWGFGRLLTTLVAGYGVWLLASVELLSFRAIWAWVAIILTAAACWFGGRWLGGGKEDNELIRPWRNRTILAAESVFWAVFLLFLLFRLINPDSYHPIWGGEKAMEFAHINAILRSAHFPPVDPWYAGGYINYYYYGEYLVAFLIKLTGIPTEIAFNLAQPTVIALLASGGFSVAAAFGKHAFRGRRIGTIGAGLVGIVLLSFAGNLVEITRLVDRVLHGMPFVDGFSYWVWAPSRAVPSPLSQQAITEFPYFTAVYADLHAHVVALPITVVIIGLVYSLVLEWRSVVVVTSIPRLVPRLVANLGIRLVILALLIGTLWPTNAWDVPMYVAVSGIGMLMATRGIASLWRRLAVAVGAMAGVGILAYLSILPFLNHYVALFSSVKTRDAATPLVAVESHFGVFFLIVFVGFMFLMSRGRTLPSFLATPAIPVLSLVAVLLFRWWAVGRDADAIEVADALTVLLVVGGLAVSFLYAAPSRSDFGLPTGVPRLVAGLGFFASLVLVLFDRPVPALYLGIGVVAVALWLALVDTTDRFLVAMIAGGMLLGSALEIVYLQDDLWNTNWYRMNTVFKFYNQLWVLFALASAGLIARMLASASGELRVSTIGVEDPMPIANESVTPEDVNEADTPRRSPTIPVRRTQPGWAVAGLLVSTVMILASLAYPLHATSFRLDQHFAQPSDGWTLDAYDWMNYGEIQYTDGTWMSYKDDQAAIDWFNENVGGTPVIAEASFGTYRCNGSRFSIATGLPDVIGWKRHEQQQRYQDELDIREQALREFYTTPDVARKQAIIQQYDIRYVIVGETERKYPTINGNDCVPEGSAEGIAAIDSMVGSNLEVAFTSGTTTVYRVIGASGN